ncbi:AraC family transcriptional regulator [Clostridium sp. Maddingley MBC34-26]|uniref:AraC family transcriptional regulator n=2 Tax=unclassified Clostridium TaxID=2614128 RepID=UPI000C1864D1|nr:AraC family transcriptional regulator [Clostridium sp. Maddingley MBC34-26]
MKYRNMMDINKLNLINNLDLKLYYCGTQKCNPNHSWGPAIKEHFKIHYIHKGKGIFKLGNETYHLKEGQGFLILPNIIAHYKADEKDPWEYSWCAFDGINAEAYLKRANLTIKDPILEYNKDDKLSKCFEEMIQATNAEKSSDLRLQSLLYLFLATIIDETVLDLSYEEAKTNRNMYINKVIDFIYINYSHKIRVSELAKFIGLDRKYISKLFKEMVGVTIQDYLISFRINKAKEMMKDRQLSIGDISRSVGYDNPLIFSKTFKKITGLPPSKYRSFNE